MLKTYMYFVDISRAVDKIIFKPIPNVFNRQRMENMSRISEKNYYLLIIREFFNDDATKVISNKTRTVLFINEIFYLR